MEKCCQEDFTASHIFGERFFNQDGTWKYNVPTTGSTTVQNSYVSASTTIDQDDVQSMKFTAMPTWADLANAHPTIQKYKFSIERILRMIGLNHHLFPDADWEAIEADREAGFTIKHDLSHFDAQGLSGEAGVWIDGNIYSKYLQLNLMTREALVGKGEYNEENRDELMRRAEEYHLSNPDVAGSHSTGYGRQSSGNLGTTANEPARIIPVPDDMVATSASETPTDAPSTNFSQP
jgi:hypothetical protein